MSTKCRFVLKRNPITVFDFKTGLTFEFDSTYAFCLDFDVPVGGELNGYLSKGYLSKTKGFFAWRSDSTPPPQDELLTMKKKWDVYSAIRAEALARYGVGSNVKGGPHHATYQWFMKTRKAHAYKELGLDTSSDSRHNRI